MSDPLQAFRRQTTSIGMITPSGNIVVERITAAILADFPSVSAHFSRVTVVGSGGAYARDYDWDDMLRAAELLGHAQLDAICWNGSKGGSLGFDKDRRLCERIRALTGIAATTSTLVIEEVFRATGVRRFGLVTPYADAYADTIPPVFAGEGFDCVAGAHAGLTDNFSYCRVPEDAIAAMIRRVARAEPQAIIAYCTNFPAAPLVDALERELGIPIYDSVSAGVWGALRLAGVATASGRRWGRLFDAAPLP